MLKIDDTETNMNMSSGKNPEMNISFSAVESNPTMVKEFKNTEAQTSMVVASLSVISFNRITTDTYLQKLLIIFQSIINQPTQIAGTEWQQCWSITKVKKKMQALCWRKHNFQLTKIRTWKGKTKGNRFW